MTHPITDKALDDIMNILEKQGINDYVIALRDPDSPMDVVRRNGSVFWVMGLGQDLIEQGKIERQHDLEQEYEQGEYE